MNQEPLPSDQQFPLSYNSYAAFDALSLKQLMKQRLLQNGVFNDQIFEGSNFNNLLDVVAYSYNVLLYYLNQTSNESLFSNSQLYENMNKIVKLINYKPLGVQSSILNFNAIANSTLAEGVYTIPRFSFFAISDVMYSFNRDITFVKNTSGFQDLTELYNSSFLYQGKFVEYPLYVGIGEDFEEFTIVSVDGNKQNQPIDYTNIFVFVRDGSGYWREWERVDNLFLINTSKEVFEIRLNENQRHSIKFGNNNNGKKLKSGDLVSVYYLKSDKDLGNVGAGTLNSADLFYFNTPQYNQIMQDVRSDNVNILTVKDSKNISFLNENASVPAADLEDSNQIRKNAPNFFKQQGRLVTVEDFKSYIETKFSNLLVDVAVVNNWDYLDGHIRYMYNLGLSQPMLDSRILTNQVMYADSCNFNNIYLYCVPSILKTNEFSHKRGFLAPGLKDVLINELNKTKMSTVEIVFQDPVYYGVGLGAASQEEIFNKKLYVDIVKETQLQIVRRGDSSLNSLQLKKTISNILLKYFSFNNTKLGFYLDLQLLTQSILNVDGVESVSTIRNNNLTPGISLLGFNTVYNSSVEDIKILTQNVKLPYFQIPFWYAPNILLNQINVIPSELLTSGIKEY